MNYFLNSKLSVCMGVIVDERLSKNIKNVRQ